MPERTDSPIVGFAEWDHMLAAAADLMRGPSAGTTERLEQFFAPEAVDLSALFAEGALPDARVEMQAGPASEWEVPRDTEVLVVRRAPVGADLVDRLPRLRHIQKLGERPDTIDLEAARARGVTVELVARPALEATADHAVLLTMAALRGLPELDRLTRSQAQPAGSAAEGATRYNWLDISFGRTLHGSTVGIIGLGEVGLLVAKRLAAFGANVVWTSLRSRAAGAGDRTTHGATYLPLDELLSRSDAVTLHVPGSAENRHVVDAEFLAAMRSDAVLVNVSRGILVDEEALAHALRNGGLRSAGLDVHGVEPLSSASPLLDCPNAILTPHIAGGPRSLMTHELLGLATGVRRCLDGASSTEKELA